MAEVRLQKDPFDAGAELARLSAGRSDIGAVVSFTGLVRDHAAGEQVHALTLEHYPGMTERQMAKIAAEAEARWPLTTCLLIHRYGRMDPGEQIVLVAVGAAHRDTAFDAARFLIDRLKTEAPFWKREHGPTGEHWVAPRAEDEDAAARWKQPPKTEPLASEPPTDS